MLLFQPISSVKNPQVTGARELSTRKGREARQAFLCEGEHLVMEALENCPQAVESIFVAEDRQDKYASLLQEAFSKETFANITLARDASPCPAPLLYVVPQRVMEALTQVKTPQGIAAVVKLPPSVSLTAMGPRLLLLENVQDPGNVGTILRTMDAAGFDGCIFTPGCADPFAPKTLRATMGSLFRVPMAFTDNLPATLDTLKAHHYALLSADLSGEPFYQRQSLPEKLCLMIGNEGAGLSPEAVAAATHRFCLPMAGGAESLNAAVAAAIMMYDLTWR